MKLTIVVPDSMVMVDGIGYRFDLSQFDFPSNLHAVQWTGEKGWEEFVNQLNVELKDIDKYQPVIDAWNARHTDELAKPPLGSVL